MKLWAMPCRAIQDRWVMVESSDKMWSLEKGMANHFSILALRTPWRVWPHGLYNPWNSPDQNIGVDRLSLLQGIFLTQELNPGLPHCRQILYQLSHKGSPRILEWVAFPFSRESSQPRNRTQVSHTAGRFFTNWVIREAPIASGLWFFIVRK